MTLRTTAQKKGATLHSPTSRILAARSKQITKCTLTFVGAGQSKGRGQTTSHGQSNTLGIEAEMAKHKCGATNERTLYTHSLRNTRGGVSLSDPTPLSLCPRSSPCLTLRARSLSLSLPPSPLVVGRPLPPLPPSPVRRRRRQLELGPRSERENKMLGRGRVKWNGTLLLLHQYDHSRQRSFMKSDIFCYLKKHP